MKDIYSTDDLVLTNLTHKLTQRKSLKHVIFMSFNYNLNTYLPLTELFTLNRFIQTSI